MRIKSFAACCVSGILALSLVACGGSNQAKEESVKEESAEVQETEDTKQEKDAKQDEQETKSEAKEEKKDERQVLGTEDEGAVEVALTNGLEKQIVSVSLRATGEESYANNLLSEEGSIAAGEEVRLFVAANAAEDATYDVLVKVEGEDAEVEFAEVPLASISKATLMQGDDVAYVDYTTTSGEEGSTKDAAVARKQAAEEAAAAEAAAQQEAQDAGAEQYYEPEPVQEEYYYEPVQEYYEPEPAPVEAPSETGQSEDACAGDVVLRY